MNHQYQHSVLIIGSGAAGLSLALKLAEFTDVGVISKLNVSEGSTWYAQGGVSAVLDDSDSVDSHVEDTLVVGAGLSDPEIVRFVVERGPKAINWLISQGVDFTTETDASGEAHYHLHREAGHSHRRIIHAADATGMEIEKTLVDRVKENSNITLYEYHTAIDFITSKKLGQQGNHCYGAYVLNQKKKRVHVFKAKNTVLASGGAGKAYLYTSNPDSATGDGIAMAWRAGCRIANMEFIQFHPTCLYHPHAKSFLITEALRGEGAKLLLPDGERFMARFDERMELAPRDVVARTIDHEMKRLGLDCVYLDISHKDEAFLSEHFPTIFARCLELGIDISKHPIPVVPAAHYTCGGVMIDNNGVTDIDGLYAIGEVTHSGLHGANRMASNSLLECIVFAHSAFEHIRQNLAGQTFPEQLPEWDESMVTDSDEEVVVSHNWDEIRRFMWDYVGIVRTDKRLQRAQHRIDLLQAEIAEYYGNFRVNNDLIELRNLANVSALIIESAMLRQESRGLHYTLDYPEKMEKYELKDTVLQKKD